MEESWQEREIAISYKYDIKCFTVCSLFLLEMLSLLRQESYPEDGIRIVSLSHTCISEGITEEDDRSGIFHICIYIWGFFYSSY